MTARHALREIKGRGFIIRVIRGQEADVILRILSSTGEKISAFAKAGLKSQRRFAGALQPLLHIDFRATKKEGQGLLRLEEAGVRHDFKSLKEDMERLTAASYAAELVEHSAQEGLEQPEIYNLFGATLKALEVQKPWFAVARQFEVKLLAVLGWLPGLNHCSLCLVQEENLFLDAPRGTVTCRNCGVGSFHISQNVQNVFRYLLKTSMAENDLQENEAMAVAPMTTALLQSHWGSQKLKSIQFLGSLHRFQK